MAENKKHTSQRYADIKARLWNQPRPRRILERLEEHGASPPILEVVAGKFATGRQGEAEIQAAIYYDLLRHRDRTARLERVEGLQLVISGIRQDLLKMAGELQQLKSWEAYRTLGYLDWGEFLEKDLGLSEETVDRLLILNESGREAPLDTLLQILSKGYTVA